MGLELALPSIDGFNGALNENFQLTGVVRFVASKFTGKCTVVKGNKAAGIKATTFKELKDQLFAQGVTKDELKLVQREYDSQRHTYHQQVKPVIAAIATDPRFKASMKVWRTPKTGKLCINAAFREAPEASETNKLMLRIAELEKQLGAKALPAKS